MQREGTREPRRRGAISCCGLSRQPHARSRVRFDKVVDVPVVLSNGVLQVQSVSFFVASERHVTSMTVADNCEVSAVACGPSFWTSLTSLLACPVEIVMSEFDIFVSSKSIATLDHMKSLKYITLDGNTGHFDEEIDLAGSDTEQHQASIPCSSCSFTKVLHAVLRIFRFPRSAGNGSMRKWRHYTSLCSSHKGSAWSLERDELILRGPGLTPHKKSTLSPHQMAHAEVRRQCGADPAGGKIHAISL